MTINFVDVFLVLIIAIGVIGGWYTGFVLATLELATLIASALVALAGYSYVADVVGGMFPGLGVWISPLSFLAIFLVAHLVIGMIAGLLIRAVPRRAHAHRVNRLFGIVPGLANGVIAAAVVSLVLLTMPIFESVSHIAHQSMLAGRLAEPAHELEARIAPIFDPAVRKTMRAITIPPDSRTSKKLPFKVAEPKVRRDLEARMLEMLNEERAAKGLKPLQSDAELAEVARAHSRDMFARSYFSHGSPEGADLSERLRKADVRYLAAGENLALAQTLPIAHHGLMKSPGHRANILRPQFGRVGIGVLDGGVHGLMVTQNFRN